MYSPPPTTTTAKKYNITCLSLMIFKCSLYSRSLWPLAAICCLGIILFLIAATIVLALIPLYLSTKQIAINNNNVNSKCIVKLQTTVFDFDAYRFL
jgi:hypothetical protein